MLLTTEKIELVLQEYKEFLNTYIEEEAEDKYILIHIMLKKMRKFLEKPIEGIDKDDEIGCTLFLLQNLGIVTPSCYHNDIFKAVSNYDYDDYRNNPNPVGILHEKLKNILKK